MHLQKIVRRLFNDGMQQSPYARPGNRCLVSTTLTSSSSLTARVLPLRGLHVKVLRSGLDRWELLCGAPGYGVPGQQSWLGFIKSAWTRATSCEIITGDQPNPTRKLARLHNGLHLLIGCTPKVAWCFKLYLAAEGALPSGTIAHQAAQCDGSNHGKSV